MGAAVTGASIRLQQTTDPGNPPGQWHLKTNLEMREIISEKDLERTFSEELNRTKKVWVIKLLSTFIKGLPDRMILCRGGYVGFAEIKTTGKKPTKIQLLIHGKLEALGFKVFVIDDLDSRDIAIGFFLRKVKEINGVPGKGLSL